MPAACVTIDLVAQCAELPPLEGAEELNLVVAGTSSIFTASSSTVIP